VSAELRDDAALASAGADSRTVAFVDASALVALADRDDASHTAAVAAYRDLVASGFHLFTTDLALADAHELLIAAIGPGYARLWLARCRIPIYSVAASDLELARQMVAGLNVPDAPLADAIHLAVLDRLGVTDVFAVDRAFLRMLA
jgi:predicted nucleic acid-binding protein